MTVSIISCRLLNGHHALLCNGRQVGEVWRYPRRPTTQRARRAAFGMRLDGYLWRDGGAVALGRGAGFTTVSTPRLKDAVALATATLFPTTERGQP